MIPCQEWDVNSHESVFTKWMVIRLGHLDLTVFYQPQPHLEGGKRPGDYSFTYSNSGKPKTCSLFAEVLIHRFLEYVDRLDSSWHSILAYSVGPFIYGLCQKGYN